MAGVRAGWGCGSITCRDQPRAARPKRKDYQRVALAAAQDSAREQATAHVLVLEAADRISDAEQHLSQAHAARDHATGQHTAAVAAFAELIGPTEAARRLELPVTTVRSAQRTTARPPSPAGPAHAASGSTAALAEG